MKKNQKNKSRDANMKEALKRVGLEAPYQNLCEKLVVERAQEELGQLLPSMVEHLIAMRTNADLIRCYMERYIERIDSLLAVVDEVKWPEPEDDEEYDDEYDEEDDEC